MQKHTFTRLAIAFSTIFVLARAASADTINLTWDQNPEPTVIGYKVHVGTQSRHAEFEGRAGHEPSARWQRPEG